MNLFENHEREPQSGRPGIDYDQVKRDARTCIDGLISKYDNFEGQTIHRDIVDAAAFGSPIAQEIVAKDMDQLLKKADPEGDDAMGVRITTSNLKIYLHNELFPDDEQPYPENGPVFLYDQTAYKDLDAHLELATELGGSFLASAKRLVSHIPQIEHNYTMEQAHVGLAQPSDRVAFDRALKLVLDYPDPDTRLRLISQLNRRRPENVETIEPYIVALTRDMAPLDAAAHLVPSRFVKPGPLLDEAKVRLEAIDWNTLDTDNDDEYDLEEEDLYHERGMYLRRLADLARASGEPNRYATHIQYYLNEMPKPMQQSILHEFGGIIDGASEKFQTITQELSPTSELNDMDKRSLACIYADEGDFDAALQTIDTIDQVFMAESAYEFIVYCGAEHLAVDIATAARDRGAYQTVGDIANALLLLDHPQQALEVAALMPPSAAKLRILRNSMRLDASLPLAYS